jgi:hypothetical protein
MLDELREASRVAEGSPLHRSSRVDLAELVRSTTEGGGVTLRAMWEAQPVAESVSMTPRAQTQNPMQPPTTRSSSCAAPRPAAGLG